MVYPLGALLMLLAAYFLQLLYLLFLVSPQFSSSFELRSFDLDDPRP
jgi:hypothetical protein